MGHRMTSHYPVYAINELALIDRKAADFALNCVEHFTCAELSTMHEASAPDDCTLQTWSIDKKQWCNAVQAALQDKLIHGGTV